MSTGSWPESAPLPGHGVRVVLVNYQCFDLVERHCTSAALAGADVILVDNCSDPKAVALLARRIGGTAVLLDRNMGFAGGVNAALAAAGGRRDCSVVLLLNPDAELGETDVPLLRERLLSEDLDAVAPVVVDGDGRPWVSAAGGPVSLRAVVFYFLGLSHLMPWLSGFFWTRRQVRTATRLQPAWLCGAVLLVRADAWERFGTLPTDELVYAEDVAWGIRATLNGARLQLIRDVEVRHSGGASGGSHRWVDATARLFVRQMGPLRGRLAVLVMRTGLAARRVLRRSAVRWVSRA